MPNIVYRVCAHMVGLSPEDFQGAAGFLFRKGIRTMSDFWKSHGVAVLDTANVVSGAIKGTAEVSHAEALSKFADGEKKQVEVALALRTLDVEVRIKEAQAQGMEISNASAFADLCERYYQLGMAFTVEDNGRVHVGPAPKNIDIRQASLPTPVKQEVMLPAEGSKIEQLARQIFGDDHSQVMVEPPDPDAELVKRWKEGNDV